MRTLLILLAACSSDLPAPKGSTQDTSPEVVDTDLPSDTDAPTDTDAVTSDCTLPGGRVNLLDLGWTWKGRGDATVEAVWSTSSGPLLAVYRDHAFLELHAAATAGERLLDVSPTLTVPRWGNGLSRPMVLPGVLPGEEPGLWTTAWARHLPDEPTVWAGFLAGHTGTVTVDEADRWLIFAPGSAPSPGAGLHTFADVTGDGQPDLVALADTRGPDRGTAVNVWPGPFATDTTHELGAPLRAIRAIGPARTGSSRLVVADLDGDGFADVALRGVEEPARIRVYAGPFFPDDPARTAATTTISPGTLYPPTNADVFGEGLVAGDVDGDGQADLALSDRWAHVDRDEAGAVFVMKGPLQAGSLTTDEAWATITGARPRPSFGVQLELIDADGDGRDDVITTEAPASRAIDRNAWVCDTGGTSDSTVWTPADTGPDAVPPDDGCWRAAPPAQPLLVFTALEPGSHTSREADARLLGMQWVTAVGDVDDDGLIDLIGAGRRERVWQLSLCDLPPAP